MTFDANWLMEVFGLVERTAIVTGGTRGIGFMIAEGLLRAGAQVVICGRDSAACGAAQGQLSTYGEVTAVPADLTTEAGCRAFAAEVAARFRRVDVLVNNAGTTWGASIEDYPEGGWDKVMALNVKAPFMLTRALLPQLEYGASGDDPSRVINIGSIDGLVVPGSENFAYSASKAALHHLTRVLAKELAHRHILVNGIAPGPFESKMTRVMLEKFEAEVLADSPLGRIGRPVDLAAAAVYLASAAGSYVTGSVLIVDGGISTTVGPSSMRD
jgi:NAD(P)-dependent dehydrogenase (short-subunit alcohol dehydrogenase family)